MSYEDLVSIVVPTYNDAPYLLEAIQDLLNQTHKNIEIIIVNDGSTDNTEDILKQLAEKYNNIVCIKKENGGTGSALNVGFKAANAKYVTWVSSDDRKSHNMIERLLGAIKENNVEYSFSAYYSNGAKKIFRPFKPSEPLGKYVFNPFYKNYVYNNDRFDTLTSGQTFVIPSEEWLKINLIGCHSGVNYMFTKRLKEECGDFLCMPGEDYYMSVLMGSKTDLAYVDEVLGIHNNYPDSLSSQGAHIVAEADRLTRNFIIDFLKAKK